MLKTTVAVSVTPEELVKQRQAELRAATQKREAAEHERDATDPVRVTTAEENKAKAALDASIAEAHRIQFEAGIAARKNQCAECAATADDLATQIDTKVAETAALLGKLAGVVTTHDAVRATLQDDGVRVPQIAFSALDGVRGTGTCARLELREGWRPVTGFGRNWDVRVYALVQPDEDKKS